MVTAYRIYGNDGLGGPVNDASPVAATTDLAIILGPLQPSTDTVYLVRAYDTTTGLEEANTEAMVRLLIGPNGLDHTGLPNPPHALAVSDAQGGGCRICWAYSPDWSSGLASGFNIYMSAGNVADTTSAVSVVPYLAGIVGYSCLLPGPFTRTIYTILVRSFNTLGTETNSRSLTATVGLSQAIYLMDPVVTSTIAS
jgi:hypothetical protein